MKIVKGKRIPDKKNFSIWKPVLLAIVSAFLFIFLLAGGYYIYSAKIYKPNVDTDKPPFDIDPVTSSPMVTEEPSDTENSYLPEIQDVYNRRDQVYNFLVLGKDTVGLNTDVIMIVCFDVPNMEINILQIPRDTYIEYNSYPHRINDLYAYLYTRAYYAGNTQSPSVEGIEKFASVIQQNMNIKIDYTFLIDLGAFAKVVNAIGGVEIDVPEDMDYDDPDQDLYIHIKKGPQTLYGDDAEGFVRFRSGYVTADIGRIDAQKIFMTAMFKKIKSSFNIQTIDKLVEIIINNVQTNMSFIDATHFADKVLAVDLSKVNLLTLPGIDARANITSGAWYYIMRRADALPMINRYFNVYDKDISNDIFDKYYVFTDESKEHFMEKYYADPQNDLNVKTAEDVDKDSIDIPRTSW